MGSSKTARPPSGLGAAGRASWRSVVSDVPDDHELDARELELLAQACRSADHLAELDAVVANEGRNHRRKSRTEGRAPRRGRSPPAAAHHAALLSAIGLEEREAGALSPKSLQARRAAEARWVPGPGILARRGRGRAPWPHNGSGLRSRGRSNLLRAQAAAPRFSAARMSGRGARSHAARARAPRGLERGVVAVRGPSRTA
jgi:hypothetical protein